MLSVKAPNTIKMYTTMYEKIKMKDESELAELFKTIAPTYASLYLKALHHFGKDYPKLYEEYKTLSKGYVKKQVTGTYEDLIKAIDFYDESKWESCQKKLLCRMYLELPIRNDLWNATINGKGNHIKDGFFYLNNYKTVKVYGPKKYELSKETRELFDRFVKMSDDYRSNGLLFFNRLGKPIEQSKMTVYIGNMYFKATGLRIKIWDTRKIKISREHKSVETNEDLQKLAEKYGHTIDNQLKYYCIE